MRPVAVRILHPAASHPGPLAAALDAARGRNAERLARLFAAGGAEDVLVVREGRDGRTFGARVRTMATAPVVARAGAGLVLLGAGSLPLASAGDIQRFLEVAGSGERRALTNNRYSGDIVAVGVAAALGDVPELPGDNALPRWLEEVAGLEVQDLRDRWRLAMDLDSPLDVLLVGGDLPPDVSSERVSAQLEAVRAVCGNRRTELVVAGRLGSTTLAWLERAIPCRVRALIEERGLRAATPMPGIDSRPPHSVLGMTIDDRGPDAFGSILAHLGDATIVDTRVLLAHRLGADERDWPSAEDRFASDLLLPERISDPWLRDLTTSAVEAAIPILLGGHSLVGPGIRLALRAKRGGRGRA